MGNCLEYLRQCFQSHKIHRISGRKLRQIRQIAEGGYGFVLLVKDIQSNKHYAMKKMICQSEEQKNHFRKEVDMMKELSHCSYVIGYFGSHQIERGDFLEAYILMQLAEKTVLDIVLKAREKNETIAQDYILKIVLEVCRGLHEMHKLGIIHKDVKVQNILISQSGRAKLCDFGSCDRQKINLSALNKTQIYRCEEKFQKNTTLMYRPPEMIDLYLRYPVDERVDIWMLGCVLFVMNYQFHPFQEEGKLSIVNASIKYPAQKVSVKMENLIRSMLTPNPLFRTSLNEIIDILERWNELDEIKLNKVAQMIKDNEELMEAGDYEKAAKNEWRNLKDED